ncbi:MAG: hypothetical protein JW810_13400 [Sedimentisphaerales bacterium]|nr:hypothetical protein [Sedimentisphaerales bacterium]
MMQSKWYVTAVFLLLLGTAGCLKVHIGEDQDDRKDAPQRSAASLGAETEPARPADRQSSTRALDTDSGDRSASSGAADEPPAPAAARADGGQNGWADIAAEVAGSIFLDAEHGAIFYAFDALAHPNEVIDLTVRLQDSKLRGIADAEIGYYFRDELIGTARTNADGLAASGWKPPGEGHFELSARIRDIPNGRNPDILHIEPAALAVLVRPPQERFVVIDLDHTLVDSSFYRVLLGAGRPMADSARVTRRIAERYSIIYLTHRPDLMTQRSKTWLRRNGYPPGPLLVSRLAEAFGSSGRYKSTRISTLQDSFDRIAIGIGDKISDAQAYLENGLQAYLIPHYDDDDAEDLREMARQIRILTAYGPVQVVGNWNQIEQGIFDGQLFPAERFARWLDDQAKLYD